jgi:hypothetical protein
VSYINFNNIQLTEVCNRLGLPIIKHGYGGNYKVKNFGGLIIKDSYFYQHSTGEKGGVIKFVMLTEGCSYQAAIELIKEIFNDDIPQNSAISETQHSVSEDKKKTNILFIPPAWNNEHKIINYLESRYISRDLINQEIKANRIKGVSIKGHLNVAFLCYDLTDHTLIKGAIIRGVEGSFKGNLIDSDGDYGYCIGPNQSSVKSIYIFEAPIDLLSYLTMYQQDPNIVYTAMGGVKPRVVEKLIERFNPSSITCCTDNDIAGDKFYNELKHLYSNLRIRRQTSKLKDWNEDLQNLQS